MAGWIPAADQAGKTPAKVTTKIGIVLVRSNGGIIKIA
jgi:hypothetical protein